MAHILAVGVATLDIIHEVANFPAEDSEIRALSQRIQRGGNATNTLVVLSQLGHHCGWGGVLVDTADAAVVLQELGRYGIDYRYCSRSTYGRLPTSCVTLSRGGGTRTIVHYRDLPEFSAADFLQIPLEDLEWLHFEGRNVEETCLMMQRVRDEAPQLPVSLEVEKPRDGIERLFPLADLLLFSPAFADAGSVSPQALLAQARELAPHADLICSLGEHGAMALGRDGVWLTAEACPPPQVVDTLGAGDTFNAAIIHARLQGDSLQASMRFACALAGSKCGQAGFDGLSIPPRAGHRA